MIARCERAAIFVIIPHRYICWLYALSDQQPDLLGQWPTTLESSCEWGHKARSGDENDEFLCINPFHYLAKPGSDDKEDLRERIEDRCNTCIKDEPAIEGERDDQLGHCACFCPVSPCDPRPAESRLGV